jgi:hypothetical protein
VTSVVSQRQLSSFTFLVFYDLQLIGGLLLHNCNMVKRTVYLQVGTSLIQVQVMLVTYMQVG